MPLAGDTTKGNQLVASRTLNSPKAAESFIKSVSIDFMKNKFLCDKCFTATQYALLSRLMAMSRVLAGVPTDFMAKSLGWPTFSAVSVLGTVPEIWLLTRFAP